MSVTTTAGSTAAATEIIFGRGSSEFKGFGDIPTDELLDGLNFLLSTQEAAHNGVRQHRVAVGFESLDLVLGNDAAGLLAMLQRLALLHEPVVLLPGFGALEEGLHACPKTLKIRMRNDGLAKFEGLLLDRRCFDAGLHMDLVSR